uniref:Uncharacterized protein n=2 Tax=candidate division WOR-3 bacterium TaxID=2052148 RepID=A0A7C2AM01_UNCW3
MSGAAGFACAVILNKILTVKAAGTQMTEESVMHFRTVLTGLIIFLLSALSGCRLFPARPEVITYSTGGQVEDLCIHGNRLFVANGDSGVLVLDITEPEAPVKLAERKFPFYHFRAIHAYDTLVFAGTDSGNIFRFILRDTALILATLQDFTLTGPIVGITYSALDGFVYVLTPKKLAVFCPEPWHYKEKLLYYSDAVDIDGRSNEAGARIAQRMDGIRVFFASLVADTVAINHTDFFYDYEGMEGIFRNDSRIGYRGLFIADGVDGLWGVGIGANNEQDTLYRFDTRGFAYDGCASGEYVYVADGGGVSVLRMSLSEKLREVCYLQLPGLTRKLVAYNDIPGNRFYIFAASGAGGLHIFRQWQ